VWPFAGLRIDRLEVAGALERDELGFAFAGLDVALAHRVRHFRILCSVHEDLTDAERQQLAGRGFGVAIRDLFGHPAHERGDGAIGADSLGRLAQV
jgi:hypothetical protein